MILSQYSGGEFCGDEASLHSVTLSGWVLIHLSRSAVYYYVEKGLPSSIPCLDYDASLLH
jgi:hypothetical protein